MVNHCLRSNMVKPQGGFQICALKGFRNNRTVLQCLETLQVAFGDSAPSKTTVYRWFQQFKAGKTTVGRQLGSGRKVAAVTQANIAAVRRIVEENPRVTYQEIQDRLEIGSSAAKKILHDHLKDRMLCSRWLPHCLTATQMEARRVFAADMLTRFSKKPYLRLKEVITGDERWSC